MKKTILLAASMVLFSATAFAAGKGGLGSGGNASANASELQSCHTVWVGPVVQWKLVCTDGSLSIKTQGTPPPSFNPATEACPTDANGLYMVAPAGGGVIGLACAQAAQAAPAAQ